MRWVWRAGWLALAGVIVWSIAAHPWGWLYGFGVHPYPESSSTPWTYQLWSGFLPALTVLGLLGSVAAAYHVHNCHQDGCWRIGKHKINGTPWCSRHQGTAAAAALADDPLVVRLDRIIALLENRASA